MHTHAKLLLYALLLLPRTAMAGGEYLGAFGQGTLCSPRGIDIASNGSIIVESGCWPTRVFVYPDPLSPPTSWALRAPSNGLAIGPDGSVFVTEEGYPTGVRRYSSNGTPLNEWGTRGTGPGQFEWPTGIAVDDSGCVYVSDYTNNNIQKFTANGGLLLRFGQPGMSEGRFGRVAGICVDAAGRIYAADLERGKVLRFARNGEFDLEFWAGSTPTDVALSPGGTIFVPDYADFLIREFTPDGSLLSAFGGGVLGIAWRVAVDREGVVYVTEQVDDEVSMFRPSPPVRAMPLTIGALKLKYR